MDGSRIILLPNVETGLLVSIIADLSVLLLLLCVSVVIFFLFDGVSAYTYTQISVLCAVLCPSTPTIARMAAIEASRT